jgi:hypothetical protein
MSDTTWRIIIAVILMAHGLGHVLGTLAAVGVKLSPTHSPDSWLFTRLLGDTGARTIGFVIWLLALVGFVGAGLGLLGWLVPAASVPALAIGASVISLAGLALFWNAFPFFFPNKVGVIVVDVAVPVYLIWI